MNALRSSTTGRYVRNPVSADRYWRRVQQLAASRSMAEAQHMAADELRLQLIFTDAGELTDWYEKTGVRT